MVVKVTMKVVHFLRVLQSVAAEDIGRYGGFLDVLQELFLGLLPPPAWIPEVARNNIIAVILPPRTKHSLMEVAASQETFLSFLLEHLADWGPDSQPEDNPVALLQVSVELLLGRPARHLTLFRSCLHLASAGGLCLERPKEVEGRQVKGKTVVKVSWYCWTVSHLGFYLSTLDRQEFSQIELILLRSLLDQSASLSRPAGHHLRPAGAGPGPRPVCSPPGRRQAHRVRPAHHRPPGRHQAGQAPEEERQQRGRERKV